MPNARDHASPTVPPPGREGESKQLLDLVAAARAGRGGALAVRGDLGAGKTALLRHVRTVTDGMIVLSCAGTPLEAALPFAALHELLLPVLARVDVLAGDQAAALRGALAMEEAPADRFLVALATLTLLAELAGDAPLLLLADDVQWLDPASADVLAFVSRRVSGDPIALLCAGRRPGPDDPLRVLPELSLGPLPEDAAARVLDDQEAELAAPVRARLLAEAAGNPLALRTLPRLLSPGMRGGRLPLPDRLPLGDALTRAVGAATAGLEPEAAHALLVVALEETGRRAAVGEAVRLLGLPDTALAELADTGLVRADGDRIVFSQPLMRWYLRQAAPSAQQRAVHAALGAVFERAGDTARQAIHLAAARTEPDAAVADLLDQAARRAARHGGIAAAAPMWERAADLSPGAAERAERLLRAADAAWQVGRNGHARILLDRAAVDVHSPAARAERDRLNALLLAGGGDVTGAMALLADGAAVLARDDPAGAAELRLQAVRYAFDAEAMDAIGSGLAAIAELPLPPDNPVRRVGTAAAAMLHGRTLPAGEISASELHSAMLHWVDSPRPRPWMWPPPFQPSFGYDDTGARAAYLRAEATLRDRGMAGGLPVVLAQLCCLETLMGEWADAVVHAHEGLRLTVDIGERELDSAVFHGGLAYIAAAQGRADDCHRHVTEVLRLAVPGQARTARAQVGLALGLLELGEGRPAEALEQLLPIATPNGPSSHRFIAAFGASLLVEAAVRAGRLDQITPDVLAYVLPGRAPRNPVALAREHHVRALMATTSRDPGVQGQAVRHFEAALAEYTAVRRPFVQAGVHLDYGEWLRRNRRRAAARPQLRTALRLFTELGAQPAAQRARAELAAAGFERHTADAPAAEDARAEPAGGLPLTPQELQVARLAAAGLSNRRIAAQLFLSPRTVAHHLHAVFGKLDLRSRAELPGRVP
ncbi:AAA family ATPase [Allonocardiopsis opalescens]|uniref:ATP/maltotriose-dependent transcriptional regulator MalT n=1 Tax=Allonocardiopsis opalescens TaxID=1144618 RepID=A0A2T0QFH7_9ACTN|nr:LuxR family transcriptional regulator [Allonocardiopsis opalescens]PRY02603.1 ATP/maltotriose-dependent transcriptional regulator MalT [Allonocardiopsis opalescens]